MDRRRKDNKMDQLNFFQSKELPERYKRYVRQISSYNQTGFTHDEVAQEMRQIEEEIGVPDKDANDFRKCLISYLGSVGVAV